MAARSCVSTGAPDTAIRSSKGRSDSTANDIAHAPKKNTSADTVVLNRERITARAPAANAAARAASAQASAMDDTCKPSSDRTEYAPAPASMSRASASPGTVNKRKRASARLASDTENNTQYERRRAAMVTVPSIYRASSPIETPAISAL